MDALQKDHFTTETRRTQRISQEFTPENGPKPLTFHPPLCSSCFFVVDFFQGIQFRVLCVLCGGQPLCTCCRAPFQSLLSTLSSQIHPICILIGGNCHENGPIRLKNPFGTGFWHRKSKGIGCKNRFAETCSFSLLSGVKRPRKKLPERP